MKGLFGAEIEQISGRSRERVSPAVLEHFARGPKPTDDGSDEHEAITVTFSVEEAHLVYDADLEVFAPLALGGSTDRTALLVALSRVAARVARLHESGRIHGDIRPACVRQDGQRTALVVASRATDPRELLAIRLAHGASPADVAFAAPEVAAGLSASAASDVYAIAALVVCAVTGRTPLGLVNVEAELDELPEESVELLVRALAHEPSERPSARDLSAALLPANVEERRKGSVVGAVFVTGAVAVFTGFLGLTITRFAELGVLAKLVIASFFTLLVLGVGVVLVRRSDSKLGIGLVTLGAQLAWADAYLCLGALGLDESLIGWAIAGVILGALQAALAMRLSSVVLGWFAAVAFGVVALTLGLVLPARGMGAALYAASVACAYLVGARVLLQRQANAVARPLGVVAGAALCASVGLSLPALRELAPAAFAWPYLLALVCFAASARSLAGGLLLVAPTLQALALVDRAETPHVAAFATLMAAALLGMRASRSVQVLLGAIAGIWAGVASIAGLVSLVRGADGVWLVGLLFLPYLLALGHALVARGEHRLILTILLAAVPVAQAVVFRDSLVPLLAGLPIGLVLAHASTRLRFELQRPAFVIGLALAAGLPVALGFATRGDWSRVALLPLAAGGTLVLSFATGRSSRDRRTLELVAVLTAVGAPLLISLPSVVSDLAYSSLALVSGVSLLLVALWKRRLFLAFASAVLSLLILGVQYFAKLSQAFHWGLLSLGLGLFLVTLAVLYEKRIRVWLPKLGVWEE